MNTLELKSDILRMLVTTNDTSLLEAIKVILKKSLSQGRTPEQDWWDELNPEEQAELELAIQESFDEANLVSNEEVFKKYEAWMIK